MEIENKTEMINVLKQCLNKEIRGIYVTGYSEVKEDYNLFSTMDWWYYIEFENFFLCIASSQARGMIQLYICPNIQCNFELYDGDVFTVAPINNKIYLGQEIVSYDLIYGNFDTELFALGIQFKDNRYVHKDNKYVFFDSMTFDGIEVGVEKDRDRLLEDNRFYMKKFPE